MPGGRVRHVMGQRRRQKGSVSIARMVAPGCQAVKIRLIRAIDQMTRDPLAPVRRHTQKDARRRTDVGLGDRAHQAGTSTLAGLPGPKLADTCATDRLNGPATPSAVCSAWV